MAVKANATISIYRIKEVTSTTNYYLLQSSTAAAPSKPTTDSPGGKWTTSEPAYTDGSTLTLYTVIKTKYSDNTFEYTPVSKSTSYEAAKSAYNKAQAAQNSATSANNKIDNLEIGGRNLVPNSTYICTSNVSSSTHLWGINKQIVNVIPGETYTLSQYYNGKKTNGTNTQGYAYAYAINDEGTKLSGDYMSSYGIPTKTMGSNIVKLEVYTGGIKNCYIDDIYQVKLEKGNKSTDWTPAPEDSDNVISQDTAPEDTSSVWFNTHDNLFYKYNGEDWIAVSDYNEDISKLKEDVGKIDSTIDGKINAYNNEIKNTYYTKAQVDSQIETNERGIKEYYSGTLQTIREDTTGLSNRITAIEGYIQKGLDDNGQPFVELGTQASPYKLKITNDAIQITYLGEPVSNWKQDLIELNTVITSYLNLGKFSFVINSDDSLSFRKIR